MPRLTKCPCGSGEYPDAQHDGYGIFLCYTCPKCERAKLSEFRADIFERYDTDEPIESD
jgi:hypothetical protein